MKRVKLNTINIIYLEKGTLMKQTQLNQTNTVEQKKGNAMNWTQLENDTWIIRNIGESHATIRHMPVEKTIASALTDLTNAGDERKIFLYKPDGNMVAIEPIEWATRNTCGHCGESKPSDYRDAVIDGKNICPKCFYENPSLIAGKWKTVAIVDPKRQPIIRYSSTPEGTLRDAKVIIEKGLELGLWIEPKIYPPNSDKPVSIHD